MECEIGSKAFIIESNRIIREVTIVRKNSDFYVVALIFLTGNKVINRNLFKKYVWHIF